LPEIREFERTSTTVINSYLMPVMQRYLGALESGLRAADINAPIFVMQSNGGAMTAAEARSYPVHILESGPAAGVTGAVHLAASLGIENAVTFDMGGTTAKAAMIENGAPSLSSEYQVGAPISIASRVLKGGGYTLRTPTIDIAEVGAGGGSIVAIDQGGALRVGPRSAGASPGPSCYGLGGTDPTVTDANLLLGYLNPEALLGGNLEIDKARAEQALATICEQARLPLLDAAYGVYQIANATMMRAIRAVSSERGRDVRDCALIVFGGNGPVHAAEMARSLGISRAIIPRGPGVFSALGLLRAHLERHFVDSCRLRLDKFVPEKLEDVFASLANRARKELATESWNLEKLELIRIADLRYHGQSFELQVPVGDISSAQGLDALANAFHHEHRRTYGHSHDSDVIEIVNARIRARIAIPSPPLPPLQAHRQRQKIRTRPAYFGRQAGLLDTPILARADLAGTVPGPVIIEEYDATIVVPPGASAMLDEMGNVLLNVGVGA
jgi:N-methylhydantoinase A